MSEAANFFNNFKNNLVGGLNTCAIGKIQTFDPKLMKADILVLPDESLIKSVPVATLQTSDFLVRIPYKKDDHVLVVFAQRDIEGIMYNASDTTERMLSLDDAIVIGGINLFTNNLPETNANDIVIGKKDLSSKVVIGANGDITIESAGNVKLGSANASEGVPLGDQLKTWLDNHTHPTPNGTSGAPNSASPTPSQGVKVE